MARNDQIVRILTVARALSQSRRGVSLKALAERHGWPWRTVYRDVDALDRAGFPIEKEDGRHRLIDGWNAPHLPGIEPDEILALYTIRALAESWRATALGRPLDRLWMKLTATGDGGQGALMPVTREPWFAVRSPMGIDYRAHDKTIATFDRAARDHLAVNCRYRALSTGQITARVIEPGELYWDPGLESLYVIGWCRLRQDVRVFAMHRFAAASLTDESFAPRREARSKAALRGAFRVWRDENIKTVRVRFAAEVAAFAPRPFRGGVRRRGPPIAAKRPPWGLPPCPRGTSPGDLGFEDFLGRQPSGVFERLSHIIRLEIRMVRENLVDSRAVGHLSNHDRHGDPHSANAGPPTHDRGVEGDAIEAGHVANLSAKTNVLSRNDNRRG